MIENPAITQRIKVLLSCQRALLGAVTPNLRQVQVDWKDNHITLYFVYNGDFTEEDIEEAECVATEVIASFPFDYTIETKYLRIDFPQTIGLLAQACVYARKETKT